MAAEIERKYDLPDDVAPSLHAVGTAGDSSIVTLTADYFDTLDWSLIRAGITLRHRRGGDDAGWHLKVPVGTDTRDEKHVCHTSRSIPREVRALVADVIGAKALVPRVRLTTVRRQYPVHVDGATVLVAQDDVSAQIAGTRRRWREVEVELTDGPPSVLDTLEAALHAQGIDRSPWPSKLARATAEIVPAEAVVATPVTAMDVVMAYIADQIGVLQSTEEAVRDDAPDAVHKARVAIRRLRSALHTYRSLFSTTKKLSRSLRDHAEQLGLARDAEVIRDRVSAELEAIAASDVSAVNRLTDTLRDRHERAFANLLEAMDKSAYEDLQMDLMTWLADPNLADGAAHAASSVLPPLVRAEIEHVEAAVILAEQHPDELLGWHEVRKLAKVVRYACEGVASAFGDPALAQAKAWEAVTEALGAVQDTVVMEDIVRSVRQDALNACEDIAVLNTLLRRAHDEQLDALSQGRQAVAAALEAVRTGWPGV